MSIEERFQTARPNVSRRISLDVDPSLAHFYQSAAFTGGRRSFTIADLTSTGSSLDIAHWTALKRIGREKQEVKNNLSDTKKNSGKSCAAEPVKTRSDSIMLKRTQYFRFGPRLSEKRLSAWRLKERQLQRFLTDHSVSGVVDSRQQKEQLIAKWIPQDFYSDSSSDSEDEKNQEPELVNSEERSRLSLRLRGDSHPDPGNPLDRVIIDGRRSSLAASPPVNDIVRSLTEAYIRKVVAPVPIYHKKKQTRPASAPALTKKTSNPDLIPHPPENLTTSSMKPILRITRPVTARGRIYSQPNAEYKHRRSTRKKELVIKFNGVPQPTMGESENLPSREVSESTREEGTTLVLQPSSSEIPTQSENKRKRPLSSGKKVVFDFGIDALAHIDGLENRVAYVTHPSSDPHNAPPLSPRPERPTSLSPKPERPTSLSQTRASTSPQPLNSARVALQPSKSAHPLLLSPTPGQTKHRSANTPCTTLLSPNPAHTPPRSPNAIHSTFLPLNLSEGEVLGRRKKKSFFNIVKSAMQKEQLKRDRNLEQMPSLESLPQWKRQLLIDAPPGRTDSTHPKVNMTMSPSARKKELMGMVEKNEMDKSNVIRTEQQRRADNKWSLVMSVLKLDVAGREIPKSPPPTIRMAMSKLHPDQRVGLTDSSQTVNKNH